MFFPKTFTLKDKIYFLIYPFLRLKIILKILRPFFKHPILTLKNSKYFFKKKKEENLIFLGTENEDEFFKYIEYLKEKFIKGEIKKPEIVIFKAYCEKPLNCVCKKSPKSKYYKEKAQRRFNEFCNITGKKVICKTPYGYCKVGETFKRLKENEFLKPEIVIMLDENQMTDIWEEFMDFQAKNGYIKPFLMDVCPLAHWMAEISLYRIKTPIGIVFPLTKNVCKTMNDYIKADGGMKKEEAPTLMETSTQEKKEEILKKLNLI